MPQVALAGVVERDIDFLLVEEFVAADGFLPWFLGKIGVSGDFEPVAVTHSVTTATGETDIELTLRSASTTLIILLENKIDANLQPRQPERYRDRAARYITEGQCSACTTVLVAPMAYFPEGDPLGFDHTIPYEDILDWFLRDDRLGPRKEAKIALLQRALARGSAGWIMVPDETATDFWRRYWELSRALAPELRMVRPDAKPAGSTFTYFRPSNLPKGVALLHKVSDGNVDLQLAGMASALKSLREKYGGFLEPGMTLEVASKSAVFRLTVPPIDIRAPFQDSEPALREGIWAAKLLNVWAKRAGI